MKVLKRYALVYSIVICMFAITAVLLSKQVTYVEASKILDTGMTIVIDAGHGGEDGGAVSCTGAMESHINLAVAQKLNDMLHLVGFRTYMIRDSDAAVYSEGCTTIAQKKVSDLKNRVAMVNGVHNAVLVSIHQNQFTDGRYSGAQVFYADTDGSKALAEQTQSLLVSAVDPANRRLAKKSQAVYLMKSIQCTGILVECGFLSNRPEEAKLRNAAYQQKLAIVIANSLSQYVRAQEVPTA